MPARRSPTTRSREAGAASPGLWQTRWTTGRGVSAQRLQPHCRGAFPAACAVRLRRHGVRLGCRRNPHGITRGGALAAAERVGASERDRQVARRAVPRAHVAQRCEERRRIPPSRRRPERTGATVQRLRDRLQRARRIQHARQRATRRRQAGSPAGPSMPAVRDGCARPVQPARGRFPSLPRARCSRAAGFPRQWGLCHRRRCSSPRSRVRWRRAGGTSARHSRSGR